MSMPPVAGTARIIAKLLSSRPTQQHEIPDLIEGVHTALSHLGESRNPTAADIPAPPEREEPSGQRRRQRATPIEPASEAASPPPAPKLLRRAEVVAPDASGAPPLLAPRGAVRGI